MDALTLWGLWVWWVRRGEMWEDENFESEEDGKSEKIMMKALTQDKMQDKKTWELWVTNRTDWSELTGNYRRLSKIPKHSTDALTLSGLWVWRILKLWEDHDEGCDPKRTLSLMCEKRRDVRRWELWAEEDGNSEKIMMKALTLRGLWVSYVWGGKTCEDARQEDMRTLSSRPNWPIWTNRKL